MEVKFSVLMKSLSIKSLVSGDKAGRLLLEFRVENDDLISKLNRIMRADEEIKITIERP